MAQISRTSHSDPPESFPQCDFEDKDHPFCDWVQVLQDGGRWTQGSANTPSMAQVPSEFPQWR